MTEAATTGQASSVANAAAADAGAAKIARTYAEALLNAAAKTDEVDEVLAELDAIRDQVFGRFPVFTHLMASPIRTAAEKDRLIERTFDGRALPTVVRFLRVLNRHGRMDLIGPVSRAARIEWDRRQNRRSVLVWSAVPLTSAQAETLKSTLAQSLGSDPVLTLEVDPSLIGGLVVQVGDVVYDASVRSRLEQLRNRLIEGKTHEIQSRRDHFSHSE